MREIVSAGFATMNSSLKWNVIAISVTPGMQIKLEQPVLVLEAMKMENNVFADKPGIVKTIRVAVGDTVMQGDILIEIE